MHHAATSPAAISGGNALRAANLIVPALAASLCTLPTGAGAHPHVWVTVKATVLYANQTITGVQEAWTFDEFYSATAIEGLDANGDGKYDRKELAALAQVNIDGLKEFGYFTFAKLGGGDLKFNPPVDHWLEHTTDGILTLHFTLPLERPVLADAPEFTFSVNDPSYFIAFSLAKDHPVNLGTGAPPGCTAAIHQPAEEESDAQALSQAFSGVLGSDAAVNVGGGETVAVHCAKS
jgi:ABC-type uncharacterized transport system substrate-binding protein